MVKRLMTCDCMGSQRVDAARLGGLVAPQVDGPFTALCGAEIETTAKALAEGDVIICCAQEQRRFEALAEELDVAAPAVLDLRDRAGWSADEADNTPKMAALMAEALLPAAPARAMDVQSEGLCLILGPADITLPAAEQLQDHLSVTVLLSTQDDIPDTRAFDVIAGQLHQASGAFGQFQVSIREAREASLGGAGARHWSEPKGTAQSECDIILDLTGGTPLFSAHEKRDGYLRADPAHAPGVAAAVMAASHLVGVFEKPLYVRTESLLCAHSRAEQTGCTRCLDLCPTGAITPDGDHVQVDPMICAGCGACSAACPSGAISYDAPPVDLVMRRVQTLAKAYQEAGGTAPRLLVVDAHGAEMIRLSARHGQGLPADVIPLELPALNGFGHAECVAAIAAGFASVTLVPGPGTDRDALEQQIDLACAIAGARVAMCDTSDPDAMSAQLYDEAPDAPVEVPLRPMGTRRQITRTAAKAIVDADALPLPDGAPYGAVLVDAESCTLCLSCVSLCPSGALGDNPDRPQLRFQEDACLQCGICATICPEDAISYEPRLNLTDAALTQVVLNEEEPFACVECGVLFGSKSAIDRITEKLTGHAMFDDPDKLRMIQMCDNCRVNAQYHSENNPFAAGERPRPRTTDDYLSKRRDH